MRRTFNNFRRRAGSGIIEATPVGSRATCNPPPTDTDEDWLVLVTNPFFDSGMHDMDMADYTLDSSSKYAQDRGVFESWRGPLGLNLILTANKEWHDKFIFATDVAKHLNVQSKEHRIALFQSILYTDSGWNTKEPIAMTTRYFTFGFGHTTTYPLPRGGRLADYWVAVDATSCHLEHFIDNFTSKYCHDDLQFAMEYSEGRFQKNFFPEGELLRIRV